MATLTQADFARLHGVSRKTVTEWKAHGYLSISGRLVDVEPSNEKLASVGRSRMAGVTRTAASLRTDRQGNTARVRTGVPGNDDQRDALLQRHVETYPDISTMAVVIGCTATDITEALWNRIPFDELRPIVERIVAKIRVGAVECLDEDGPPPGFTTWADHPWFTEPPMTEVEWEELEKVVPSSL